MRCKHSDFLKHQHKILTVLKIKILFQNVSFLLYISHNIEDSERKLLLEF